MCSFIVDREGIEPSNPVRTPGYNPGAYTNSATDPSEEFSLACPVLLGLHDRIRTCYLHPYVGWRSDRMSYTQRRTLAIFRCSDISRLAPATGLDQRGESAQLHLPFSDSNRSSGFVYRRAPIYTSGSCRWIARGGSDRIRTCKDQSQRGYNPPQLTVSDSRPRN